MSSTHSNEAAASRKETPWIDAWIRWERSSKETYDDNIDKGQDDCDEDEDESEPLQPPTQSYSFEYSVAVPQSTYFDETGNNNNNNNNNNNDDDTKKEKNVNNAQNAQAHQVSFDLQGFPSDSEQVWNSTGLTLWRSSHYLCQYMVDEFDDLFRSNGERKESQQFLEVRQYTDEGRVGVSWQ